MFEYYLITVLLLFSFHGYGLLLSKIIFNEQKFLHTGDIFIISLFFLSFIVTIIHFFVSINYQVNLIIHSTGIILNLIYFKTLKTHFKKFNLISIILLIFLSLIMFYEHNPNEDFGYYHLPYIVNFTSEKIIFGLGSLQISQGWNSMWLNLHSNLYLFNSDFKHLYILNIIFFIIITHFFLTEIINNSKQDKFENKILFLFSFIFLIFFIIKFSRINSYGIDVPGNYLLIISVLYFLKFTFFKEKSLFFIKLLILSLVLAITIRISNLPMTLILLFALFKIKFDKNLIFSKFSIIVIIFSTFWVIQQYIYTGCILFPSNLTCFIEPPWSYQGFISEFKALTYFSNKSYASYTGLKSIEDYHENFYWVSTWLKRNFIELIEFFAAFLLSIFILKIFSKKQNFLNNEKKYLIDFYILLFSLVICIFIWFYNSPIIRMGNHFIMLLLFFLLYNFNFFHKYSNLFENKKNYLIIFILSILFFISKNFNRIAEIDYEKNIWPNLLKVKFETENKYGLNLNRVIQTSGPKTAVCWSTKFICRPGHFNDLVFKRNKYGYLFIFKAK